MDDLTRERYPEGVPWWEKRRRDHPSEVARRRRILTGVEHEPAPSQWTLAKLDKHRKLVEAIRTWVA